MNLIKNRGNITTLTKITKMIKQNKPLAEHEQRLQQFLFFPDWSHSHKVLSLSHFLICKHVHIWVHLRAKKHTKA